jgi:hypothetical protein
MPVNGERTVEEIDRELKNRVDRRTELRSERVHLKGRVWPDQDRMDMDLKTNQQRIDAQTEAIARLMDEREVAEARCPDTLDELTTRSE